MKEVGRIRHHLPGSDGGIDGNNRTPIQAPKSGKLINPSHAVNSYKSFLREQMARSVKGDNLKRVLDTIENNENIRNLYNTLGLINDLETIEDHYLKLRKEIDFWPYIESLLNRTQIHASNLTEQDSITASRILFTTIKSKIVHMKTNENRVSVVDLPAYLEMVRDNIISLKQAEKAANIDEYKIQFQKSVEVKITQAHELVKTEIIPELEDAIRDMNELLAKLIDEIKEMIEADKKELVELNEKRYQANISMIMNIMAGIIGVIAAAVSVFFPVAGALVGLLTIPFSLAATGMKPSPSTNNSRIDIPQKRNRLVENKLYEFTTTLNNSMAGVKQALSRRPILLSEQLDDIERIIIDNGMMRSNIFTDILSYVRDGQRNVRASIRNGSAYTFRESKKYLKNLGHKINVAFHKKPTDLQKTRLEQIGKLAKIGDISIQMYNQIRSDQAAIAAIDRSIQEVENRIKHWQEVEEKIFDVLIPMVTEMQQMMEEIMASLSQQTAVEIDISKWRMQGTIRDIKTAFKLMSTGTSIQPYLERAFDKLDEAMTLVITTYDRIDSYKDKAEFATYLTDMISGERPAITDPALNSAVLNLKKLLQSNRVLDQWEIATKAYTQHQFPFAATQLSAFDLPPSLEFSDTNTLIDRSVEQLNFLRNQLILEKTTIGKYDREVYSDMEFHTNTLNRSSISIPFYVWNYEDISDEITRFLKGEEIILTADIRKGLNLNAVKFNTIEFVIVAPNPEMQLELNQFLDSGHAVLSVSMLGNNYYRCGEQIFYISMDESIVLEFSEAKIPGTTIPIQQNDVYRKIAHGEYFLSPYTMWKLQLKSENFKHLNSTNSNAMEKIARMARGFVGSGLRLELVGRGQYFKNELFAPEVCSQPEMRRFYHEDKSTTPNSVLEAVKFRYSLQ